MAGELKGDFINAAYSRARISGLTVQPSSEDLELALDKLEDMAAMWAGPGVNINSGYAFEDSPDPNTPHNVPRAYWSAYKANLALLLLTDFGKIPLPTLVAEAKATLSSLQSATAVVKKVPYSPRQPIGAGNTLRYGRWNRFYSPQVTAPNSAKTVYMTTGDINNFVEHFDSFLTTSEDVVGYVLTADSGLTVLSESLVTPDVNFQIEATSAISAVLQVKIVVTTTLGRVETRVINFEVTNA